MSNERFSSLPERIRELRSKFVKDSATYLAVVGGAVAGVESVKGEFPEAAVAAGVSVTAGTVRFLLAKKK